MEILGSSATVILATTNSEYNYRKQIFTETPTTRFPEIFFPIFLVSFFSKIPHSKLLAITITSDSYRFEKVKFCPQMSPDCPQLKVACNIESCIYNREREGGLYTYLITTYNKDGVSPPFLSPS